jgi:hypothetical protein
MTDYNPFCRIANSNEFVNISKIRSINWKPGSRGKGILKYPIRNFFRKLLGKPTLKPKREYGYYLARVYIWYDRDWDKFEFNSDAQAKKFMKQFIDELNQHIGSKGKHFCSEYEFTF